MNDVIVHIAGHPVQVGQHLRQRCSWCGGVLIDEDLTRVASIVNNVVPEPYPTWQTGALIRLHGLAIEGGATATEVAHEDGQPVPDECCAKLGPEVTR